MKNIFSVLLVSIFLFGCSKDDDTSGSIIGEWEMVSKDDINSYGYIDPITGEEVITSSDLNSYQYGDTIMVYIVFRDDETCSDYVYFNGGFEAGGDYDYIKDGDMVSILYEDEYSQDTVAVLEITKLTSTDLHWSQTSYYEWDGWNGDTTFIEKSESNTQLVKSDIPSFTTVPLNKQKPIGSYNSFLHRRTK